VTMTDPKGIPIRDVEGDKIEHKLAEGENTRTIASRLTLKIFNARRGDMDGCNRLFSSISVGSTRAWSAFEGKAEMNRWGKPAESLIWREVARDQTAEHHRANDRH
jgi:hypothetical protein